jgi:hypothetical protein
MLHLQVTVQKQFLNTAQQLPNFPELFRNVQ